MNKNKSIRLLAIFLCFTIIASVLTGCAKPVKVDTSGAAATQDYPVEVNGVTLTSKPEKVVALSGSIADVILAMNYEAALIAATPDCTQEDFISLTKIDPTDTQAIIALAPDTIISESYGDGQIEAFNTAGITCFEIVPAKNREDFERLYSQIGSILGGASTGYNNGISAAQKIFTSLDDLSRVIPKSDVVITGSYIFDTKESAVTGESLATTVMTYSGITNVLKGTTGGTYDFENLKITNPDYLFCPIGMKSQIMSDSNFKQLNAVTNDKVYEIDEKYVRWEGRTVVMAATIFAGIAYPQLLEESTASATMEIPEATAAPEVAAATPAPTVSLDESKYTALKDGDQGDGVLKMQAELFGLGFLTVEYDGMYGAKTIEAVKAFQKKNSLPETGDADTKTLALLFSGSALSASATPPAPAANPEASTSTEASKAQ